MCRGKKFVQLSNCRIQCIRNPFPSVVFIARTVWDSGHSSQLCSVQMFLIQKRIFTHFENWALNYSHDHLKYILEITTSKIAENHKQINQRKPRYMPLCCSFVEIHLWIYCSWTQFPLLFPSWLVENGSSFSSLLFHNLQKGKAEDLWALSLSDDRAVYVST